MEAVVHATEEQLGAMRKMGVEIVCTDRDAVILPPFTHKAIREEVRRYLRLFGSGETACKMVQSLAEAVIRRTEKALGVDGSLNWDEVWGIISACDAEAQRAKNNEEEQQARQGGRLCQQQNSSAQTEKKFRS